MKLTLKQRRFADEYIRTGNISESYRIAYPNVKSENAASSAGSRLLRNVKVEAYIDKRMEELKKESIAEQDEVLQYLTAVMRGQVQDEMLLVVGDEMGSEVERHEKRSDTMARTKAAELLGKRYRLWTDKVEVDGLLPVTIVNDLDD